MSSDILGKILATKAEEIMQRAYSRPLTELQAGIEGLAPTRGFIEAIETSLGMGRPAIIAEIKRASPSKGVIRADFDPAGIARSYAGHGATCLSVLTDETYFQGHDNNIGEARRACGLPVIRKDFIIDPYQVFEARLIGADAILLIVAALGDPSIRELVELAHTLGLDVLVEVHNNKELERALRLPCRLVGINNRNLRTFETSLDTTLALLDSIPENRIVVTESGIRNHNDVLLMQQHNVHTFLVGEAFMRAKQPGEKLQELFKL